MGVMRIYRAASGPVKKQFWMTVVAVTLFAGATLSGQMATPTPVGESWFTFQNLVTAAILIYGLGMNVQNFREQGRRIADLEKDFKEFKERTAPDTYLRQDVFEERMGRRSTDPILRK